LDENNVLVGVISEADIFRMIVKSKVNSETPVPA